MQSCVLKLVTIPHFLSLVLDVFASHCEACLVLLFNQQPLAFSASCPDKLLNTFLVGRGSALSHLGLCRLAQRVCDFIQVWFLRLQDQ